MADDSADNWRKKYTVARDRLEQQERYLSEVESLMRHTIARLSIVAESGDPRLSRELDKLRKAARADKSPAELRALLESVAATATRLEHPAQSASADLPALSAKKSVLRDVVDRIQLPDPERASAARTAKSIDAATIENELGALVKDFADIVNRAVRRDIPAPPPKTPTTRTAQTLLAELLSCLPVPSELSPRLESLKEAVELRVSDDDWRPVLGDVVKLIVEMRRRLEAEKLELEEFLLQLQDRLKDLDQQLEVAETTRRASVDSSQQLDRRVDAEVSGIESSVHQADSLEQIKATIQQRVEVIRTHMDEHRRAETQRQTELEEKLKHATSRLQAVEKETTHLRAHLRKRKHQAMSDPLTGIPNRAAFDERLEREFQRWKRYATPLTLLVLDVDHFKNINDTYGHETGDQILRHVGSKLLHSIRESDLAARFGGEEFLAILSDTDQEGAMAMAEKIRRTIEDETFPVISRLTISIGVAAARAEDENEDSAVKRADAALYRAKGAGRNAVRFAS